MNTGLVKRLVVPTSPSSKGTRVNSANEPDQIETQGLTSAERVFLEQSIKLAEKTRDEPSEMKRMASQALWGTDNGPLKGHDSFSTDLDEDLCCEN